MKITYLFRYLVLGQILIYLSSCEPKLPQVEDLPEQAVLPDPFQMFDGRSVLTREDWFQNRKPELRKLFQHYIYGYLPPSPAMNVSITKIDSSLFNGRAVYKEIKLELLISDAFRPNLILALFIPLRRSRPAPVFIGLNKCGNHTLLDLNMISIDKKAGLQSKCQGEIQMRGSRSEYWSIKNTILRGYALATCAVGDIDPDEQDRSEGIPAKYQDAPGDSMTKWGTIAAWAWGIHRIVDYLYSDQDIDHSRICVTGWSRRGKAALFASAMDDRIDLVVPHQSGTGGMALSRMNPSESVARITEKFPNWFNKNFSKFAENINKLPVDQHLLVALIAPRPLMDNAGLKDTWASPHLAFRAMTAAAPVYELLGKKGIVGDGFVRDSIGESEFGRLLQFQRDTDHILNLAYWNAMLDFADRQFNSVN